MSKKCFSIVLVLLAVSAITVAKPQYGLVGAWDFENGYTDVSGVAPLYTGTVAGAVSVTTDPIRGKVATCTGNGRINIGPSSGGKLDIPDAVSMACWIKINKTATLNQSWLPIMGKGGGGYRLFLHGAKSDGTLEAIFPIFQYGLTGGGSSFWVNCFPPDANNWLHIGCAYDGDYQRIYLNGQLFGQTQVEDFNTLEGYKRDLWSGTACPYYFSIFGLSGYSFYSKGSIDNVAVYRGVLDTQDFNDLYTGAKTMQQIVPKPPYGQFAWDQSLVAAYGFEGDTAELSPGAVEDGILKNGAVLVSDPNQGNVLAGSSDPNWYLDGGFAAKFDDIGQSTDANEGFTVTAWIKPDVTAVDGWAMIASKGGAGFRMYYHSVDPVSGGRTLGGMLNAGDTPSGESMGNGGNMLPGNWYHVAMVYNANYPAGYDPNDPNTWDDPNSFYPNDPNNNGPGRLRGFIDGLAAFGHPSEDISPNHFRGPMWDTSADPLTIRTALGGFAGKIDDVRVYNRPLNQLEIRWVMEQKCGPAIFGSSFTDDCSVNTDDFNVLVTDWLNSYNLRNLSRMSKHWLE